MKILPIRALTLAAAMTIAGAGFAESPDLATLSECSDRAWAADIAAWADYAFDRHVTRRSLDNNGAPTYRQELRFRLTPKGDGFDEELVEIEGRRPTPDEVAERRKKAVFTKHYRQAEKLELANPVGEDLALMPILREQEYRLVGEDEIDGVPCYRVEFDARAEPKGGSAEEKLQHAAKGSGCFSVEGCHLVVFEMETVRPVKHGPVNLRYLRLGFAGQAVDRGWLLKSSEMQSDIAVLGKKLRKYNSFKYSNFRHQP